MTEKNQITKRGTEHWIAGIVDIVIILGALYLFKEGHSWWFLFLILLLFTGGYSQKEERDP